MRTRSALIAALLAALAALALSACGGGSSNSSTTTSGKVGGKTVKGLYGSLPTSGTPTQGGTISLGQLSGDTPTYLFPIIPSANATDGTQFVSEQLWIPLYNTQVGGQLKINYATSAAEKPVFSDGDRRVTIHLRPGLKWSDGKPVTATDALFDIALLKAAVKESAANWERYTPGLFPDNLRNATAPDARTLVLTFKRNYNPAYLTGDQLAGTITPLPSTRWDVASAGGPQLNWRQPAQAKRIYDFLNKAGKSVATFGSNPLWNTYDGPFSLSRFSATNSSFTLNRNPGYSLAGKVRYAKLNVETFTSTTTQLSSLKAGTLDVAAIDFSQLGQVSGLQGAGYHVYGYPNIGTFSGIFNYKDKTNHFGSVISQLYARQALAHLEDQPAYIKGIYKNAAAAAYGPLPTLPKTPYTPASAGTATYPYSISAAAKLLKDHGWKVVPGGQTTCAKAGSGAGECGPGIPAGTPFKFQWWAVPESEKPSIALESEAFASAAKQVGIEISIGTKTFNFQIANYNNANPANRHLANSWGVANWGEFGTNPYPTEDTIFNSDGTSNFAGYSSPTADRLIKQSLYGHSSAAATRTATFLAKDEPVLFFPCADVLDAVSKRVGGTDDSFLALTQDVFYPQYWYVKKG